MKDNTEVRVIRNAGRWGVMVDNNLVAENLPCRTARRRARGLLSRPYIGSNTSGPIMDNSGRCLTREERGLEPLPKK